MAKKDDSKTAGKTAASTKKAAKKAAKKKVSKKKVAKKKVVSKKTASKKVAKKTTAKKAGTRKPTKKSVSDEDRRLMIAMHAYYKWENAGFPGGQDWQHWLEAEKEVEEILG